MLVNGVTLKGFDVLTDLNALPLKSLYTVGKASGMFSIIIKEMKCKSKNILLKFCFSPVSLHMEYYAQVCSPGHWRGIYV